jgi:hypothetical protein
MVIITRRASREVKRFGFRGFRGFRRFRRFRGSAVQRNPLNR